MHPRWSNTEAAIFPPELIKLMQRCWRNVSACVRIAAFQRVVRSCIDMLAKQAASKRHQGMWCTVLQAEHQVVNMPLNLKLPHW